MAAPRCCKCNGVRAKCFRCACSRSQIPCSPCHPGGRGSCHNPSGFVAGPVSSHSSGSSPRGPSPDPDPDLSPSPIHAAAPSSDGVQAPDPESVASPPLPSFTEICRV